MMNHLHQTTVKTDHLGCLGNFNAQQELCREKCALSLRCVIATNQQAVWEQFETLFEIDDMGGAADQH